MVSPLISKHSVAPGFVWLCFNIFYVIFLMVVAILLQFLFYFFYRSFVVDFFYQTPSTDRHKRIPQRQMYRVALHQMVNSCRQSRSDAPQVSRQQVLQTTGWQQVGPAKIIKLGLRIRRIFLYPLTPKIIISQDDSRMIISGPQDDCGMSVKMQQDDCGMNIKLPQNDCGMIIKLPQDDGGMINLLEKVVQ